MRIAIVGGTGKEGSGLAIRWARAGHSIIIGSRDAAKARACAHDLAQHGDITGDDNGAAAAAAELIVLTVPYAAHGDSVRAIAAGAKGKVVVDVTVPLVPPKVSRVQLPAGRAAALEAQAILGADTPVAAALHHVSHAHLAEPDHAIRCDVLVVGDDERAKTAALGLVKDLGLRGLDAGPLDNAVALESLTPVLIYINKKYKVPGGAGIMFTELPEGAGG